MPRSSDTSDPTLAKVMRLDYLNAEIDYLAGWLEVVDKVRGELSERQRKIVNELYLFERHGLQRSTHTLAQELHITRRDLYRHRDTALFEFLIVLRGMLGVERR